MSIAKAPREAISLPWFPSLLSPMVKHYKIVHDFAISANDLRQTAFWPAFQLSRRRPRRFLLQTWTICNRHRRPAVSRLSASSCDNAGIGRATRLRRRSWRNRKSMKKIALSLFVVAASGAYVWSQWGSAAADDPLAASLPLGSDFNTGSIETQASAPASTPAELGRAGRAGRHRERGPCSRQLRPPPPPRETPPFGESENSEEAEAEPQASRPLASPRQANPVPTVTASFDAELPRSAWSTGQAEAATLPADPPAPPQPRAGNAGCDGGSFRAAGKPGRAASGAGAPCGASAADPRSPPAKATPGQLPAAVSPR